MENLIYLDNAATTPTLNLDTGAYEFGNASSPHAVGLAAERLLYTARQDMARLVNCRESEIIFTSGGTEANNLAILGFALAHRRQSTTLHAAPWEHASVTAPMKFAQEIGVAQYIPIKSTGQDFRPVDPSSQNLVSIAQLSNETGEINDVSAIARELKAQNPQTIVHVDGIQGFCKEAIDLTNIDMYTFSGHKIHAGYGAGGLIVRNARLLPLLHGGGHEMGLRSGTENIPAILSLVAAAKHLAQQRITNHEHVSAVKAELLRITHELPDVHVNARQEATPYILNLSFLGLKGETLVHLLSEKGVCASMGAACRSRSKNASALEAMGYGKERAESAVRLSFSHLNTIAEAVRAREIICECASQIRRVLKR